jgi:Leucine-rich repeat (LRR) protein
MIVLNVLVIVTAVQVNSQELCPSVCHYYSDQATCTNLFNDVTDITKETFHSELMNESLEIQDWTWNITSLTSLDLLLNNTTKIRQKASCSLVYLEEMHLSGNRITNLHSKTFYNKTVLVRLSLGQNSITDIHHSTFQNNVKLVKYVCQETKLIH